MFSSPLSVILIDTEVYDLHICAHKQLNYIFISGVPSDRIQLATNIRPCRNHPLNDNVK